MGRFRLDRVCTKHVVYMYTNTYMSHKFPVAVEDLEGGLQDGDHELPQLAARRLRYRDVGQITEYIINFFVFFYKFVHSQHTVFHDYLKHTISVDE
jgi:hypothetical protein